MPFKVFYFFIHYVLLFLDFLRISVISLYNKYFSFREIEKKRLRLERLIFYSFIEYRDHSNREPYHFIKSCVH